jgi:hypothetical protein
MKRGRKERTKLYQQQTNNIKNRNMNHPPDAKRPRVSYRGSGTGSNSAASDGPDYDYDSNPDPNPDPDPDPAVSPDAVSSSRPTPAETSSSSSSTNNHVFTNDTPSTSDNIDTALCVISDKQKKYSKHEILQALKDLVRWADDDNREFYIEFLELGGMSRILNFLMVPSNMSDMDYVHLICSVIAYCTYIGPNGENMDIAQVMARKFVERGGVHTMLLANEEYNGENDNKKLRAVYIIWKVLRNVVFKKSAFDNIEKDKQLNLLDDALATLRLLNGVNNQIWVHLILRKIFKVFQFLISPNSKLVADDFEGRTMMFQTWVDAMKDSNMHWDFNENKWSVASRFFCLCYHRDFILTYNDLKLVISFFVEYIEKAPNLAFDSDAFHFLSSASDALGYAEMTRAPGLMSTLGAILDPRSNNYGNINEYTDDAARSLLKKLL